MLRLHVPDRPTEPLSPEAIANGSDPLQPIPAPDLIRQAVWVDLSFPLAAERQAVEEALGIALPSKSDMQEIEASSRVYTDGRAQVMNLLMTVGVDSGSPSAVPVSLILMPERLVTVRYADPHAFRTLDIACSRNPPGASAAMLLVRLLENVVDRTADILERMSTDIDGLSVLVFGLDKPASLRLSTADLQTILRRIGETQLVLNKVHDSLVTLLRSASFLQIGHLDRAGTEENGLRAKPDRVVKDSMKSLSRDIMSLNETSGFLTKNVGFLLDAALGRISIEQNSIVKIFSVAAVIFLPPTLVGTIYGMNFEMMPELKWAAGYPMALAMMVLSAVVPYLYFKKRGWL